MFNMLVDTCVWLDLAKDPKQAPLLHVVEEMIDLGLLSLIAPRVLLDEFQRNRDRIAKEGTRSLSTHFRLVKDAVRQAGGKRRKAEAVLTHLEDVSHRISLLGS